jgi:hypothetical protein
MSDQDTHRLLVKMPKDLWDAMKAKADRLDSNVAREIRVWAREWVKS